MEDGKQLEDEVNDGGGSIDGGVVARDAVVDQEDYDDEIGNSLDEQITNGHDDVCIKLICSFQNNTMNSHACDSEGDDAEHKAEDSKPIK